MLKQLLTSLILLSSLCIELAARDIDINAITKILKAPKQHLFIFLHRTDCGYCESMIEFTLDDDKVKALLEKDFQVLDININHDDTIRYKDFIGSAKEFAKYIDYDFYPSSVFIDTHNKIIHSQIGLQDEKDFLITLKYVNSMSYRSMDIERFEETLKNKDLK